MGVRGPNPGDLSDSEGLEEFCAAGMLKDSIGLAARVAYMM